MASMGATSTSQIPDMERRHDIDALRVLAFGLLILYHTAMAYVDGWDFHLKSTYTVQWLQWPMIAINRWRMPLLFLIGGMALTLSGALDSPRRAMARRSRQLLVPLLFGIVFIIPVQPYVQMLDNGTLAPGFAAFLLRWWTFQPWPAGAFPGAELGFTWNHLWFLPYLWVYSILVLALSPLFLRLPRAGRVPSLCRSRIVLWLLLPIIWLAICLSLLLPLFPTTHAWADDWYVHAESLFLFVSGVVIARQPAFWQQLVHWRRALLLCALCAMGGELGLRALRPLLGDTAALPSLIAALDWRSIERLLRAAYCWLALMAILAWARIWLDRPFAWLPYARAAIFPWYILHQSLTLLLLHLLRPLALGPWSESSLVLTGTIVGCFLIHDLIILRCRPLQPLMGVTRPVMPLLRRRTPALPSAGTLAAD